MFRNLLFATLLSLVVQTTTAAESGEPRPNIIFFIADDWSQEDVGAYGHPSIQTPNMDSLAANGMRFTNAYLTTSSCSPTRCSIITGRYPHNTGAPELHQGLPGDQIMFPKILKEHGYHTVLSGKHHMDRHGSPKEYVNSAFSRVSGGKGPGKNADWVQMLQ